MSNIHEYSYDKLSFKDVMQTFAPDMVMQKKKKWFLNYRYYITLRTYLIQNELKCNEYISLL